MKRYSNTRFSRPGSRGTVKPYGIEVSPSGTTYYLSAYPLRQVDAEGNRVMAPRVFWLHKTKGWRSQGGGKIPPSAKITEPYVA